LGIALGYGQAADWKSAQPKYPGRYNRAKLPHFQNSLCLSISSGAPAERPTASRGPDIKQHGSGQFPQSASSMILCIRVVRPFKIDPYVEFMVAFIRHIATALRWWFHQVWNGPSTLAPSSCKGRLTAAIKKEFPDLPVGHMIYGAVHEIRAGETAIRPRESLRLRRLHHTHLYAPAWIGLNGKIFQQQFQKRGQEGVLISTEMPIVSGADHISAPGARSGMPRRVRPQHAEHLYFNQANHYAHQFSPPICRDIPAGSDSDDEFPAHADGRPATGVA